MADSTKQKVALFGALATVAAASGCGRLGVELDGAGASLGGVGAAVGNSGGAFSQTGGQGDGATGGGQTMAQQLTPIVEYRFEAGQGATVYDRAAVQPALDLSIGNLGAVSWEPQALRIDAPLRIASEMPAAKIEQAVAASGEMSVEALVQPAATGFDGPARILSMSKDAHERNFSLLQDGFSWHLRMKTSLVDDGGLGAFRSAPVLGTARTHVVFTHDAAGQEHLYLNGQAVSENTRPGSLEGWEPNLKLIVGAEFDTPLDSRDWQGRLERLAVYDQALPPGEVVARFRQAGGNLLQPCSPQCDGRYADGQMLLYENFEQPPQGMLHTDEKGSTGSLSKERSRSGNAAMVFVESPDGYEAEIGATVDLVASGDVYARMWLYVPPGAISGRFKVLAFNRTGFGGIDFDLLPEGRLQIWSLIDGRLAQSPAGLYPEGEWFCLQAAATMDDQKGQIMLGARGRLGAEIRGGDTKPQEGVDSVVYGLADSDEKQQNGVLFVDDLVVARRPIPCHD